METVDFKRFFTLISYSFSENYSQYEQTLFRSAIRISNMPLRYQSIRLSARGGQDFCALYVGVLS